MRTHSVASSNNILISKNKPTQLIFESIIEGLAYVVVGFICSFLISNMYVSVFIIGIAMHILAELLGIHRFFCKNICIKLI